MKWKSLYFYLYLREIGWLLTLALIRRDFEPFHMLQSHVLLLVLHNVEKKQKFTVIWKNFVKSISLIISLGKNVSFHGRIFDGKDCESKIPSFPHCVLLCLLRLLECDICALAYCKKKGQKTFTVLSSFWWKIVI